MHKRRPKAGWLKKLLLNNQMLKYEENAPLTFNNYSTAHRIIELEPLNDAFDEMEQVSLIHD